MTSGPRASLPSSTVPQTGLAAAHRTSRSPAPQTRARGWREILVGGRPRRTGTWGCSTRSARRRTPPLRAILVVVQPDTQLGNRGAASHSIGGNVRRAESAIWLARHGRDRWEPAVPPGQAPSDRGRQRPPRPRCLIPRHPVSPVSLPGRAEPCCCYTSYYSAWPATGPLPSGKGPDVRKLVAGEGFEPSTSGL